MSTADKQTTHRPPPRFLALLRDVLFESTSESNPTGSAAGVPRPSSDVVTTPSEDAAVEAARTALRQTLDEQAGPALREFALQLEGLREVITEPLLRRRAALRVLSLKAISVQALVLELERLLAALDTQRETFAVKLQTRRTALEQERSDALAVFEHEAEEAERAVVRLQSELDAERTKIAEAGARRERLLADCEANRAELTAKENGFGRALDELRAEYGALKEVLMNPESS
jgi:chromosome segregation ATPase